MSLLALLLDRLAQSLLVRCEHIELGLEQYSLLVGCEGGRVASACAPCLQRERREKRRRTLLEVELLLSFPTFRQLILLPLFQRITIPLLCLSRNLPTLHPSQSSFNLILLFLRQHRILSSRNSSFTKLFEFGRLCLCEETVTCFEEVGFEVTGK